MNVIKGEGVICKIKSLSRTRSSHWNKKNLNSKGRERKFSINTLVTY